MSLQEMIREDNENVFFADGELGKPHTVNGITCLCTVDDDRLQERTDAAATGVHIGEKLLFIRADLLPGKPISKAALTLDAQKYYVRSVVENMGVYEIRLTANKP